MNEEELRKIVRSQLEWCEVFNQLVTGANIQESIASNQVSVYLTAGTPPSAKQPPPHRYLHVVSLERVEQDAYAPMLKDETNRWNALTDKERLAAAEARVGSRWDKEKLRNRLLNKGFSTRQG